MLRLEEVVDFKRKQRGWRCGCKRKLQASGTNAEPSTPRRDRHFLWRRGLRLLLPHHLAFSISDVATANMESSSVDSSRTARADPDEDLTDEQMEAMLARATARLQQNAKEQQLTSSTGTQSFNFPKLDAGDLDRPYADTKDGITTLDSSRLVDDKQRKQANLARKVEDPLTAKKAAAEVRRCIFLLHPFQ